MRAAIAADNGAGLRSLVSKACTRHVMIAQGGHPDARHSSHVDSLNVSVAGAILMHRLCARGA